MSRRFPPLRSQDEIDGLTALGWWILPAAVLGLAVWAVMLWWLL